MTSQDPDPYIPIQLDSQPHLPLHDPRHPRLIHSDPITLDSFIYTIDRLLTSPDSPLHSPNKKNITNGPEASIQIISKLYSFALEPTWSTFFFPKSAFQPLNHHHPIHPHIPLVSLPTITENFNLVSFQEEDGLEYGPNRRGKPCGHVFQKGEGVYHWRWLTHSDYFQTTLSISSVSVLPSHSLEISIFFHQSDLS